MCRDFKAGKLKAYWRSGPVVDDENSTQLRNIVADNVAEFVSQGYSVLGFYFADDGCLRHLVAAREELKKKGKLPFRVGEYSLAANDWPLEETKLSNLPRLVIFRDGKILSNEKLSETPEAVVDQIFAQLDSKEL